MLGQVPDVQKLSRLLALAGNEKNLLQLLERVQDAEKLYRLLVRAGSAEKLIVLLDKVQDANQLLRLLRKVGDGGGTIDDVGQLLKTTGKAEDLIALLDKTASLKDLKTLLHEVDDIPLLFRLLDVLQGSNPAHLPSLLQQIKKYNLGPKELLNILEEAKLARSTGVPIGITEELFTQVSQTARQAASALPYGDDIVVQGSRVRGYSMDWVNGKLQPVIKQMPSVAQHTDFDIAIRVSAEVFEEAIRRSFGRANPGSSKEDTMLMAIQKGRIFGSHARPKLSSITRVMEKILGFPKGKIQVTLVKVGGSFDSAPSIPLR